MIITTAIGIGDLIYLRAALDTIKHNHQQIDIYLATGLIGWAQRNQDYADFVHQFANLIFSEPPYRIVETGPEFKSMMEVYSDHRLVQPKPDLPILCDGQSLKMEPYIVMTTKNRYIARSHINWSQLWQTINKLPYKIVVLGEREVELNHEYRNDNRNGETVYSIYHDIITNVSPDKLVDKTIPALGITSPNLAQLRQDCLIMRDAVSTITFGIGGNFTMANAVGRTVGYRIDTEACANMVFDNQKYPSNLSTRDWNLFIHTLENL